MGEIHENAASGEGQTYPCPRCGKPLGPFVTDCPECATRIVTTDSSSLLRQHKYTFGLGELMLVIGSIAVVLGMARITPGLAVFGGAVILIALIRTLGALHRARGWKVRLSTEDVIRLIVMSLCVSFLIVVSSTIAFFATCLPTGMASLAFGDSGIPIGLVAGVGIGLIAAFWVARKLHKAFWMAGTPPKLLGIHYLEESPPSPPAPEPPRTDPEPPR